MTSLNKRKDTRLKSKQDIGTTSLRSGFDAETFETEQAYVSVLSDGMIHIEGWQGYAITDRITLTPPQALELTKLLIDAINPWKEKSK